MPMAFNSGGGEEAQSKCLRPLFQGCTARIEASGCWDEGFGFPTGDVVSYVDQKAIDPKPSTLNRKPYALP